MNLNSNPSRVEKEVAGLRAALGPARQDAQEAERAVAAARASLAEVSRACFITCINGIYDLQREISQTERAVAAARASLAEECTHRCRVCPTHSMVCPTRCLAAGQRIWHM